MGKGGGMQGGKDNHIIEILLKVSYNRKTTMYFLIEQKLS